MPLLPPLPRSLPTVAHSVAFYIGPQVMALTCCMCHPQHFSPPPSPPPLSPPPASFFLPHPLTRWPFTPSSKKKFRSWLSPAACATLSHAQRLARSILGAAESTANWVRPPVHPCSIRCFRLTASPHLNLRSPPPAAHTLLSSNAPAPSLALHSPSRPYMHISPSYHPLAPPHLP
jgi:hypothetical protein